MSTAGSTTAGRTKWVIALLMVGAALLVLLAAGCSSSSSTGGASAGDQKAMLETVGKFYAAQGALDLPAVRETLYDPTDIAGLATATVPADATKTEITWKAEGDKVIIAVPSQELTLTASMAATPPNAVLVSDPSGQGNVLVMKKEGSVWKIDVAETEKAAAAAQTGAGGQGGTAPQGEMPPPTTP